MDFKKNIYSVGTYMKNNSFSFPARSGTANIKAQRQSQVITKTR